MTDIKPWYKSKTILANIVSVIVVAYTSLETSFGLPVIPAIILTVLSALGIYGRATATQQVG